LREGSSLIMTHISLGNAVKRARAYYLAADTSAVSTVSKIKLLGFPI
jgi:hypothetical protein